VRTFRVCGERLALFLDPRRPADFVAKYAPTNGLSELSVLADLHDRGKLTDEEFAAEKARLLGTGTPAAG
jgi:Short C-terminal domain